MGWMLPDIFSGLSFPGLFFSWLILQSLCSALISFPLPDKGMHPLQAHIYRPAHEGAKWFSATLPTLKQTSSKVSSSLRFVLFFFFPVFLMHQFSFPKAWKDCLPSVGLSRPSPSLFLACLYLNMFGKLSVAWSFASGRYLNVPLPLPRLHFSLQHIY